MATSEAWVAGAGVVSISIACAIYYTSKALFDHRERMAKIQQGIDPDAPRPTKPLE